MIAPRPRAHLPARAGLIAALASALIAPPAIAKPADGKPPPPSEDARAQAKELSARAQAHFDLGEYEQAIADFKEAYRLFPSPGLLYNLGQAHRLKGDCTEALTMYRNYLRLAPETPHRAVVEKHITDMEACERAHKEASEPATLPPPDAPPAETPVIVTPPPRDENPGRGLRLVGIVSASAGVALLAAGGYFSYDAGQAADEVERRANAQEPWRNYEDVDDRGRRSEVIGAVLLATGGAAVVAGVTCYVLGRRASRETPTIGLVPAPGAAQVVVTWGF